MDWTLMIVGVNGINIEKSGFERRILVPSKELFFLFYNLVFLHLNIMIKCERISRLNKNRLVEVHTEKHI